MKLLDKEKKEVVGVLTRQETITIISTTIWMQPALISFKSSYLIRSQKYQLKKEQSDGRIIHTFHKSQEYNTMLWLCKTTNLGMGWISLKNSL